MGKKALAVLLIPSWIIRSGVDTLEDLNVENRMTGSAFRSPAIPNPIKVTDDNVGIANRTSGSFESFFINRNPNLTLLDADCQILSHKDNCVFLIEPVRFDRVFHSFKLCGERPPDQFSTIER
jgi:hypothetical protein